jgi:hypothetical protein
MMRTDNIPAPPLRYEWTSTSIMVWSLGTTNVYGESYALEES